MKEAQSAIRLLLGVTISQLNLKIMLTSYPRWASSVMPNNAIEHLMVQATRTPHGASNENLAGKSSTSITKHVQGWANEKSVYNGQPLPSGNNPAGHYTAMVWQNTKEIGCGFADTDQMNFLVCRYNPPGNFIGEMPYGNSNQAVIDDETTFVPNEGAVGGADAGVNDGGDAGKEDGADAGVNDGGDAGNEDGGDAGVNDGGDAGNEDGGDAGNEDGNGN